MLTDTLLKTHLQAKGFDPKKPLFLSLDCDRTLVNRKQGAHVISPAIIELFQKLKQKKGLLVGINTGRDWTAYQPLHAQLGQASYSLFLSGRVCWADGTFSSHPEAGLSETTTSALCSFIKTHKTPFFDAQFSFGNIVWTSSTIPSAHYKPFKPLDWTLPLSIEICPLDQLEEDLRGYLSQFPIIRVELPIYANLDRELFELLQMKDVSKLRAYASRYFPIDELELLPIPSRSSFHHEIATLRIMSSNKKINKGIGLKDLIEQLKIPQENVIMVGDSNDETASDTTVKHHLPNSTLFVLGNPSIVEADFHLDGADQDGIIPLLRTLLND